MFSSNQLKRTLDICVMNIIRRYLVMFILVLKDTISTY